MCVRVCVPLCRCAVAVVGSHEEEQKKKCSFQKKLRPKILATEMPNGVGGASLELLVQLRQFLLQYKEMPLKKTQPVGI